MFKQIVVAIDGSDHAKNALDMACALALKFDGKVHIVHAPYIETVAYALGAGYVEVGPSPEQIEHAGEKVMEEALARAKDSGITPSGTTLKIGDAKEVILGAVEETGADLVVMGRRGLGSVGSLVLGSTSLRIAHDAPCAVLTVK